MDKTQKLKRKAREIAAESQSAQGRRPENAEETQRFAELAFKKSQDDAEKPSKHPEERKFEIQQRANDLKILSSTVQSELNEPIRQRERVAPGQRGEDLKIAWESLAESAYEETGLNGTSISWRYWVHQMPSLSAGEAARLMSALDPDKYHNFDNRHGSDDPSGHCAKAEKIQRLAERSGMTDAPPSAWLTWATERGIFVHAAFRIEVEQLIAANPQASAIPVQAEAPNIEKPWLVSDPRDPTPVQPWYTPARYFARQLVIENSTLIFKKTVLADKVSKVMAGVGIRKRGGIHPLDAGTVLKAFSNVTFG